MKSKCDECGEVAADIDVGFSPGAHLMTHHCGGSWRVMSEADAALERPKGRSKRSKRALIDRLR